MACQPRMPMKMCRIHMQSLIHASIFRLSRIISLLRALYHFVHKKEAQLMLWHDGPCVRLARGSRFDLEVVKDYDASLILPELSRLRSGDLEDLSSGEMKSNVKRRIAQLLSHIVN